MVVDAHERVDLSRIDENPYDFAGAQREQVVVEVVRVVDGTCPPVGQVEDDAVIRVVHRSQRRVAFHRDAHGVLGKLLDHEEERRRTFELSGDQLRS